MFDFKEAKEKVKNLSVLIVDDEEEVINSTSQFMKKIFTNVDIAKDGQEAITKYNENGAYDIVFTDINMPIMDGWALVHKLRQIDHKAFIVIMTGTANLKNEMINECNMCVYKPIDIEELKNILDLIIKEKSL